MRSNIFSLVILVCFCLTGYSQWVQTAGTPEGGGITDMLVTPNGTLIVTCASFNWPNGQSGGIRHSTNGGTTWENDYQHFTARTLAMGQNGYVFASSWDYPNISEGLWVSFNQGAVWVGHLYLIGSNNNIFSILVRDNNQTIYIGTRTGVRKSTNGGGSFTPVNNGIPANTFVYVLDMSHSGNYIAAGTSKGLYISSNNGINWEPVTGIPSSDTIYSVKFARYNTDGYEEVYYAGGSGYAFYKGNPIIAEATLLATFEARVSNIETVEETDQVSLTLTPQATDNMITQGYAYSTDRGVNWIQYNNGLPQSPFSCLTYTTSGSNAIYYCGTFENVINGAKVYKMTSPIGISQVSSEIPEGFLLSQNYPNPFNPMTKIKFSVPEPSIVNITIFDVLGSHITTLVNERLNSGTYETEWNALNIPAGVYFYRMEAGEFSETKKIVLVK